MTICARLMGGLGNQMFQYAVARAVALRSEADLLIDVSWFAEQADRDDTTREYGLDAFEGPASSSKVQSRWGVVWEERGLGFDPEVLAVRQGCTLVGSWQNERYFSDVADVIRKDFTFRERPDAANAIVLDLIRAADSVAVHVRRGDYVHDARTSAYHGSLPMDYYRAAAETMRDRLSSPRFFIFSDEPEWCRHALSFLPKAIVVDHNPADRCWEDLRLMIACRHHIVANSSFSWWGAWLAEHHGQVVVAPRRWFATANERSGHLVPSSWLRL